MDRLHFLRVSILGVILGCASALAQSPAPDSPPPPPVTSTGANAGPVVLDWVPPALARLNALAAVKSSFTLDRDMLAAAASLVPNSDAQARQAIAKLDGVSVHTMRFGDAGITDPADVEAVREAYHLRGWKHLVSASNSGGPVHDQTTDVWVVLDGATVRGAVVLAQTPKSLTLVTVAGNLSPVELLHLRGHFGIPRFDADGIGDANTK
jgi:Domain of unknown function (DUF4252)